MKAKQAVAATVRQFAFGALGFGGALAVAAGAYALFFLQMSASTLTSETVAFQSPNRLQLSLPDPLEKGLQVIQPRRWKHPGISTSCRGRGFRRRLQTRPCRRRPSFRDKSASLANCPDLVETTPHMKALTSLKPKTQQSVVARRPAQRPGLLPIYPCSAETCSSTSSTEVSTQPPRLPSKLPTTLKQSVPFTTDRSSCLARDQMMIHNPKRELKRQLRGSLERTGGGQRKVPQLSESRSDRHSNRRFARLLNNPLADFRSVAVLHFLGERM